MRPYSKIILNAIFLKISSLIKATIILGTHSAFFSVSSMVHPVLGAFNTWPTLLGIYTALALVKWCWAGSFSWHYLAYFLPGLCASLSWAHPRWRLSIILPLLSFVGFALHPVAGHAWFYGLYWFIPVILSVVSFQNPFTKAVTATFVAHAIGSLIWAYTVPMDVAQWITLIPVVAIERFSFACGATALYYVGMALRNSISMYFHPKNYLRTHS